jgi:NADH-quinone oxidoreductase subunit F
VLTTIKYFRNEYEEHIKNKCCPAKKCTALIQYEIVADLCRGCSLCSRKCPVDAISGVVKTPYKIDSDKCVRCGQCIDTCKFNAIKVLSGEESK